MKNQQTDIKFIKAKNRVDKLKRFYNHLMVYIIFNLVITGFKMSQSLDSWSAFVDNLLSINVLSVWAIWGCILLIHFIALTFGQGWEERKIEELMEKELSRTKNQ